MSELANWNVIRIDMEDNPTFWVGPDPDRLNFTRDRDQACLYLLDDARWEAGRYSYGLRQLGWDFDVFVEPANTNAGPLPSPWQGRRARRRARARGGRIRAGVRRPQPKIRKAG